jgi:hypothetical protein
MEVGKDWKHYKTVDGELLRAIEYEEGMHDEICQRFQKPCIISDGVRVYVSKGIHLFKMDKEKQIRSLISDIFLKEVTLI